MKVRLFLAFLFLMGSFHLYAQDVKVLTMNVLNSVLHGGWNDYNWSKEDGRTRGQKTVEVIIKSQADIICIQEYLHNNEWIKEELERTTGEKWNIRILPRNCAIISKYTILPHGNMFLTPIKLTSGRVINVISSHQFVYTYLPYDLSNGMNAKDACQRAIKYNQNAYWKAIVEEMNGAMERKEPVILTGDFNEPSHLDYTSQAKKLGFVQTDKLSGLMSNILIDEMGMKDIWNERRMADKKDECSLRGMTWSPTTWDYKKGKDDQRIDFIYYSSKDFEYIAAKLVGETPITQIEGDCVDLQINRWPSDHRAVLGTLRLLK